MNQEEIIEYYASLSYEAQKKLWVRLVEKTKKPPYFIKFRLDSTGLTKLGKVTEYCKRNGIEYKAESDGKTFIKFKFQGLSERNAVLFGQLAD